MGTELMSTCLKEEEMDFQSVPPGFGPQAAFTLKRIEKVDKIISCSASASSESTPGKIEADVETIDVSNTRSLRRRPWINYGKFGDSSEDESDPKKIDKNISVRLCLPKGVIRGCAECSNCQKVTARWRPDDAHRHDLEDAPVFHPTEEEFEDTLNYIASIRSRAEQYGICRIVPPPSWKPPCPLKESATWHSSKFATRIQRVDKLQNRDSMKKLSKNNTHMRKKRRKCMRMGVECGPGSGDISGPDGPGIIEGETFGFEPGPEFTLKTFKEYADDFKAQYFSKSNNIVNNEALRTHVQEKSEPSIEDIEGEYWRVVQKPTEEIEVLYGADLETGTFGSGFPKMPNQIASAFEECYIKSGWNLNNFPKLPGSVLSYESGDISGVLVPWLYVGMCFSSFCWHVEDHHLYSMNYMHWGEPKLWYGVSARDSIKLEASMRKHLPDLFEEQPDLLHKLVTQLSPSILKSEGIPVYRCVQNSGEFVLTFPRAYHSGFNCGFNCAEAVNVAPVDWLPHGQNAIELYREQGRRTSISHDKLLLGAAREAVKAHWEINLLKKNTLDNLKWKYVCGKDGILAKALKTRVEMERARREFLCNPSLAVKMDSNFDTTSEKECIICLFDLHLSAVGCHCSPDKYACLNHAKQLCSCDWNAKLFLFRYDIDELNILVEALEGKLSAIYRWARLDLGLALSSYVSKENKQVSKNAGGHYEQDARGITEGIIPKENTSSSPEALSNESKVKEDIMVISGGLSGKNGGYKNERENSNSQLEKNEVKPLQVCQLSQEDTSYSESLSIVESEVKTIILLSDDEAEYSPKTIILPNKLEIPERLTGSNEKPSLGNHSKDLVVVPTRTTNAAVMGEEDARFFPEGENNIRSSQTVRVKVEEQGQEGHFLVHDPPNLFIGSKNIDFNNKSAENSQNTMDYSRNNLLHAQPCSSGRPTNEGKNEKMGLSIDSNFSGNVRNITGNQICPPNNLDRYFRQKGPRIAKAVRRINCNVEPLEYGVVQSGKLWCNSQVIFPKGYRSRVKYISVLSPADMCSYISEIIDGGQVGPLFMVCPEDCPKEVFVHVSATRCWEMVRERVNQEISKQHKLGKLKLPPLQPPGSLDGLDMFGFSSPAIVQAIEAMDRTRVCSEYWSSRPYSRFQVQVAEQNEQEADKILEGLLKKANQQELHLLNTLFSSSVNNKPINDLRIVTRLLREEIQKRPR